MYIVDIQTGGLVKAIDTGKGTAADPMSSNRPNGLSTPAPIDSNNDGIVDYIFAGDLWQPVEIRRNSL
jgi:type IV pilus assembly protein PilY1